jgi:chemotaxis protein methyltransferase CheR
MNAHPDNFKFVCDLVHRRAAILIETGKEYLVDARLAPIARAHGLPSVDALVAKLRADDKGPLSHEVIEAMTTNETSFFRDIHPFEALRTVALPALLKARAATRSIRIWCAAASTGQEPYSIAMTIREHFPELATWNVQIIATDINATVLARARTGVFRQLEVNRGLPASLLVKHFDKNGADWQIKANIRQMISFQELNLLERWPLFTQQDVVFMRNVLIYFDVPTKRELLRRVRESLRDDGYLFLGGAETTMNIDPLLVSMRSSNASMIYQHAKATLATG